MKIKERDLLLELNTILTRVPFPQDGMGMKTSSIDGFIDYSEDMRALVPFIQQLLMGMATVDNLKRYPEMATDYEEGFDYHDPHLTLRAIQEWVKLRNAQKWETPDRYGLKRLYDKMRLTG